MPVKPLPETIEVPLVRRVYARQISSKYAPPIPGLWIKMMKDWHDRQVKLAKEGNEYAIAYLAREAGIYI